MHTARRNARASTRSAPPRTRRSPQRPRGGASTSLRSASCCSSTMPHAVALLERCRRGLADVAAAWSGHADLVVDVDAQLGAAITAIDDRARGAERLLADAVARRDTAAAALTRATAELAEATARLE